MPLKKTHSPSNGTFVHKSYLIFNHSHHSGRHRKWFVIENTANNQTFGLSEFSLGKFIQKEPVCVFFILFFFLLTAHSLDSSLSRPVKQRRNEICVGWQSSPSATQLQGFDFWIDEKMLGNRTSSETLLWSNYRRNFSENETTWNDPTDKYQPSKCQAAPGASQDPRSTSSKYLRHVHESEWAPKSYKSRGE